MTGVQMLEVRHRPHDVKVIDFQCPDLGIPMPAPVVTSSLPLTGPATDASSETSDSDAKQSLDGDQEDGAAGPEKRKQTSEDPATTSGAKRPRSKDYASQMVARLASTIRGHTAFLTFAVKSPVMSKAATKDETKSGSA